ncbi:MAG: hypothetical protein HQL31_13810 [Planctomycetes bacterium]|nr:hypothetical protein [Planctomycetota bacterium]
MFGADREARTTAFEMRKFRSLLETLPFSALPPAAPEAVVLVGHSLQDHAKVATGAFILAQQAGFQVSFQEGRQTLKDAPLYLLPSAIGKAGLSSRNWAELRERVQAGATLYLSMDDVYVDHLGEVFGAEVRSRYTDPAAGAFQFDLPGGPVRLALPVKNVFEMRAISAEVLGKDDAGRPAFFASHFGKGKVFLLNFPLERLMMETPSAFRSPPGEDAWKLYRLFSVELLRSHVLHKEQPLLSVSEHLLEPTSLAAIAINNSPGEIEAELAITGGWRYSRCIPDHPEVSPQEEKLTFNLGPNEGVVLLLERNV